MPLTGVLIVPTSAIYDLVNPAEYAALGASAKDALALMLSCGTVDMSAASITRTRLFQIFPSGVTHDAIVAAWDVL